MILSKQKATVAMAHPGFLFGFGLKNFPCPTKIIPTLFFGQNV
jgi:hypothetical protein